jgi:hypothetical protein
VHLLCESEFKKPSLNSTVQEKGKYVSPSSSVNEFPQANVRFLEDFSFLAVS